MPLADALDYFGEYLAGPLLAALVGGPLIAISFRYFAIGREVADHDARVSELNEDLGRWVRDRNRQLETELRGLVNTAGNQVTSGSLRNRAAAAMRRALHEYRDEATAKVREFSALARSENRWHKRHRKRSAFPPPSLGLRGQERLNIARWRQRPHIVSPGSDAPDLTVTDDPTTNEPSIAPLESETGLTWVMAQDRLSSLK